MKREFWDDFSFDFDFLRAAGEGVILSYQEKFWFPRCDVFIC